MDKKARLELIRNPNRIKFDTFLNVMFSETQELAGDRYFANDKAIYTGFGKLNGLEVIIVGQRKGYDTASSIDYNFGMAGPEGYRKVNRIVKLAEKFDKPIILFIDTPGAYPGITSEERGQGQAIADMLYTLADIKVPVISIIISEGGSGGALALGVSDYIYALENCYYSVISPEGYAEILYKGEVAVDDIIDDMPIFIEDLRKLKIVDKKVIEPKGGAYYDNSESMIKRLAIDVDKQILKLASITEDKLIRKRYKRYKKFGDLCLEK